MYNKLSIDPSFSQRSLKQKLSDDSIAGHTTNDGYTGNNDSIVVGIDVNDDNLFGDADTDDAYGITVLKEKNIYKFQPTDKHTISPNKPIIQAEDLSVIKYYFDICISTCQSESSNETKAEYDTMVQEQKDLKSLKELKSDIVAWVTKLLSCSEDKMFENLATIPSIPFLKFVKFTLVDFLLNYMRAQSYNVGDERTAYCELFIPVFKVFGNTTKKLSYVWCEKKAKDLDYV